MEPVSFAEARLDELEAAANRAQSLRYQLDDPYRQIDPAVRDGAEYTWREVGADPARTLRDVDSGRRILARHAECAERGTGPCREFPVGDGALCAELADLLYRWADHGDYDRGWKP